MCQFGRNRNAKTMARANCEVRTSDGSSDVRKSGLATRQQHETSSYCVLIYFKHLQRIAISVAVILCLEQSSSSHGRAHTDPRVRLEYFASSALSLEE